MTTAPETTVPATAVTTPAPPSAPAAAEEVVKVRKPGYVLVCDLETTQTDPRHPGAAILEIGMVICRWGVELKEVARANLLVRPDGDAGHLQHVWEAMLPVVREMHTSSGLWEDATRQGGEAWATNEADSALRQWITEHTPGELGLIPMAGSGIAHMDVEWVKVHLPQVASLLTYWMIDFGVIRRSFQLAGAESMVDLAADVDAKPHRALDDALLHAAEGRRYLAALATLEPPVVDTDLG